MKNKSLLAVAGIFGALLCIASFCSGIFVGSSPSDTTSTNNAINETNNPEVIGENTDTSFIDVPSCTEGLETERICVACNISEITKTYSDCSTFTENVEDTSCASLCPEPEVVKPLPKYTPPPPPSYTCSCSKTCGQMSSCSEAYYQLNTCGCGQRDGDGDGIPCEDIC